MGALLFVRIFMCIIGLGVIAIPFALGLDVLATVMFSFVAAFFGSMALFAYFGTNRVRRLKRYPELISSEGATPLADIARAFKKPEAFVKKDLLRWIRLDWLCNIQLDEENNSVMLCNKQAQEPA